MVTLLSHGGKAGGSQLGLRAGATIPALLFLLGSGWPPPGSVLAHDQEGRTDNFGARPSAAADVAACRFDFGDVLGSYTIVVRTIVLH